MPVSSCCFNGCPHPPIPNSVKCIDHRHRAKCTILNCTNQVYARGVCVRHGGKKQCAFVNCDSNARSGLYCSKHHVSGTKKRLCTASGCQHIARVKGLCVGHGGGRKCLNPTCDSYARRGGLCRRHKTHNPPALAPTTPETTPIYEPGRQAQEQSAPDTVTTFDMDILDAVFGKTAPDIIDLSIGDDGVDVMTWI
ncbi:Aste57867_17087 [Aphanomyces stellatus]|uniref:Aste57867_17087 protein n=1 Tax=Aphanomyces stellatus TaxID=120398 RepID=A0A485L8T0_9STRA|nr:hypothetical protein As57867_017028 [Aphanomyces stellatus]VFT93847.1 Aste57867_17087 [Aphanomyces stellatus]